MTICIAICLTTFLCTVIVCSTWQRVATIKKTGFPWSQN